VTDTGEHTGGMLALVPDNADTLAVEGGEAPDELHLTLLYLGDDVSTWGAGQADQLRELVKASAPALDAVDARVVGPALFNPDGGPDGDRDPCLVLLVGDAPGLDPLRQWARWVTSTHDDYPTPPDQFEPFLPHITVAVAPSDPAGVSADGIYTGPVRFGTLRLALAGDVLDVPLGDTEAPVITETKSGEITFTPPASVIEVAAILPGPIARLVAEGKALNSRGVDWVAEHCGEQGSAWATEMRARAGEIETKRVAGDGVEVKRDMNMGKTAGGDRPALESLKDLDDAIGAHKDLPPGERPANIKRLKAAAHRLGAAHHVHQRVGSLETATTDGSGTKSLEDGIEVKIASPDPRAARLRNMWAHDPKLTKKWRPGTPGDFKRLRKHLAKYVHTPKILNGLTANIHKLATGEWPGKNAHTGKGNVGKALKVGRKSLVDWPEVEFKAAVLDLDEAALFDGIDTWGEVFAEPWTDAYLADLEEADDTDEPTDGEPGTEDLRADTARLASLGARLVVDEPITPDAAADTADSSDDGPLQLFDDAEPVTT
jgi:2'-5' RNA ligase